MTAACGIKAARPYHDFLSDWETVQLACLAAARAAIGDRRDAASKLFTRRMERIRNLARQRERLDRGVHVRSKGARR